MEEKKLRDFSFMRIDSCVSSPQKAILDAFDSQDLSSFVDRLYDEELNPNYEYPDRNFSSLLHLCVGGGHVEFTKELLRNKGTNPNQNHKVLQKYPLHVAVEQGSLVLVKSLLQAGADVNAKMADGSTALHIAALRSAAKFVKDGEVAKVEMQKNFSRIMGLLLSAGPVNVDAKNNTSGATPLYFAVDKGTEDVARQLLSMGACVNIEVDGETVEEKIEESMPALLSMSLTFNHIDTDAIENQLFHCLYHNNADQFMQKWQEAEHNNNVVNVNADNGMYTFLQYASDQGSDKLVEFLLFEKKANPNLCTKNYRMPPLVLAGHHGYYKVIKVFVKLGFLGKVDFTVADNKGENVLHRCVKRESKTSVRNEYRDYDLCLDILLDDKLGVRKAILPAVNATDQMGNTALHFAAILGNQHAVRKLLRAESNIGIKNKKMERAISFISPSIMEEFLDSCLQDYGLISDEHFQLEFKYSFLGPPHGLQPNLGQIDEANDTNTLELTEKLTKTEEEETGLSSDNSLAAATDLPEAEPLWYLAQTAHRPLLSHPVITSFLCLKWRRIRTYYYANLIFYTIFLALLTSYLVLGAIQEDSIGLRMTTLACTAALILREVFQALVSPRRYFFNMENVLEMVMLTFSVYLTMSPLDVQNQHHRNMSAAVILCSWMEFFLLLGRHPKLSTFITMFFTVSLKFLMFLTWYISIIIAFGFAFFFILSQQKENKYFKNPDKSILKTVVMSLTGELEFEGIDFGNSAFGKFVFLFYIFFIMLVLVNLLNGLAVSDITEIQKEAEIVSLNSRVDLIVFIESMLLGDPFHFLTNWPPFAWGRKLPACDCFSSFYKLGPIRWILTHSMGSTLLFNKRLLNKKAVFLPNQSRREQSKLPGPEGEDDRPNEKDNLILDDDIIESAKSLLVKKQETLVVSRMKQMEKSLLLLNKQQNLIIEMLNNMNVNSGS